MAAPEPGSKVAKDLGLALAQIYNHVKAGRVKNHKVDGYPTGKGVEVDPDEVRAAMSATGRSRKGSGTGAAKSAGSGRSRKATADDTATMHEAIDADEANRRARKRASGDDGNTVRLRRVDRTSKYPFCPVNPAHGELAPDRESENKKKGVIQYHCWHQEHDGRPKGHSAGFSPQTKSTFSEEEVLTPQPSGRLGVIMLEWIYAGRSDLAESLEGWMNKQDLPVWIPER